MTGMPRASRRGATLLGSMTWPVAGVLTTIVSGVPVWVVIVVSVVCAMAALPPISIAIAKAAALMVLLPYQDWCGRAGADASTLEPQIANERSKCGLAPSLGVRTEGQI